jgi:hypothetical protein
MSETEIVSIIVTLTYSGALVGITVAVLEVFFGNGQ